MSTAMPATPTPLDYNFSITGIDLSAPIDKLPEGYVPVMENWRPEIDGSLSVRPGQGVGQQIIDATTGPEIPVISPVHTIRRMTDTSQGAVIASLRNVFAGAGTRLNRLAETGLGNLYLSQDCDGPYSGNPLDLSIYRPTEAVSPYAYIGDSVRMRKVGIAGAVKRIGLPQPMLAPQAQLSYPFYKSIALGLSPGWVSSDAAVAALHDGLRIDDATRTVTKFLYDSTGDSTGSGWASVQPTSVQDIGAGMRITVQPGAGEETVTVHEAFTQSVITKIQGILYENLPTNTGRCAVHLITPVTQAKLNALLYNRTKTEYARILSAHPTIDGYTSIILSTPSTWAAGDFVQCVPSFRAYFSTNHPNGTGLRAPYIELSIGTGAPGGTSYASHNLVIDLSNLGELPSGKHRIVGFRAPDAPSTRPDDLMGVSLWIDRPNLLTEMKIMLDIDPNTTDVTAAPAGTNQPFLQNFLQHVIRANDFSQLITNTQTLVTASGNAAQRGQVDVQGVETAQDQDNSNVIEPQPPIDPEPPDRSNQSEASQNQYAELRFRISELLMPDLGRMGSNRAVGLADVKGMRISVTSTGPITVRFMGWYIGGGFGPDVEAADRSYLYAVRARDSATGVVSNLSPAFRGGVRPQRQRVQLTCSKHPAIECDKLDWFRYGGKITGWVYLGSSENSANPEFWDSFADRDLTFREVLSSGYNEHYQPWPQLGVPIATLAYGSGTLIVMQNRSDTLRLLAPGTPIKVAGDIYIIYRCYSSVNGGPFGASGSVVVELTESFGYTDTVVPVEISEPVLLQSVVATDNTIVDRADYFPILKGPFHGFYLGLGDKLNAGWLYCTNGNDPDSTQQGYKLEVTQPSEPLQNLLIFEEQSRCILWSSDRTFVIEPSFSALGDGNAFPFTVREISASVGLGARWACCIANGSAVFMGKDGLYSTSGGAVRYISESLRSIFPHEGSAGFALNANAYVLGLPSDDATAAKFRLAYADRELYFDYPDSGGTMRTLVIRQLPNGVSGWRSYKYAATASLHYGDEGPGFHAVFLGGTNGKVYKLSRLQGDDTTTAGGVTTVAPIVATLQTAAIYPPGGIRESRYVADELLDYDTQGATITVTPQFDNATVSVAAIPLTDAAGRITKPLDLSAGQGQRARNCSLLISVSVTSQRPVLYGWSIDYSGRPVTSLLRGNDYSPTRSGGAEWVRGVWIHADTYDKARSAKLEYVRDNGTTTEFVITPIQHKVYGRQFYPVPGGIYLTASRLRPTDANSWDFAGYELEGEPAPPLSTQPQPWQYIREGGGATLVQTLLIDADTEGASVKVEVQSDQGTVEATLQPGSNGGALLSTGRGESIFTLDAGFVAHLSRIVPLSPARIFRVALDGIPYPEITRDPTPWIKVREDGGAGFVQGALFDIDTFGLPVDVLVEADGVPVTTIQNGANMGPLTAGARIPTPISFDVPFIAHLVRFTPQGLWRRFNIDIDSRPETDMAYEWKSQQKAFGKFSLLGDGYLSLRSTSNIVLNIIADGVTHPVTFYDASTNTGGERRRLRFRCPAIKAKSIEFEAHAATTVGRLAIYEGDFLLEVKEWGFEGSWQTINPLGGPHFAQLARWQSRSGANI